MLEFVILLIDLISLIFQLLEYKKNNRADDTVIIVIINYKQ